MTGHQKQEICQLLQNLAQTTLLDGRPERAMVFADAAISLDSGNAKLLAMKAYAALEADCLDDAEAALEAWEKRIDTSDPASPVNILKAMILHRKDKLQEARQYMLDYGRAQSLAPVH